MKCTKCKKNFRKKQMTAEGYQYMLSNKKTTRFGKEIIVTRQCRNCGDIVKI